jgi:hypothetical protein
MRTTTPPRSTQTNVTGWREVIDFRRAHRFFRKLLRGTTLFEERAQQLDATISKYTTMHFNTVIQARIIRNRIERFARARFGISRSVNQATNARIDRGTSTHRTRLKRDDHRAFAQSPLTEFAASLTNRNDFRMTRRISSALAIVRGFGEDFLASIDNGSNGDFPIEGGLASK